MGKRMQAKPKFYAIIIVIMILCFGISCAVSAHRLNAARDHADQLVREKEEALVRIRELNEELEYVKSDDFIIHYARDVLKLVKPGEIRYTNE